MTPGAAAALMDARMRGDCGAANAAPEQRSLGCDRLRLFALARTACFFLISGEELGERFSDAVGDIRRRHRLNETQRFGEPASILKQALGFLGHLRLLEMVDQLRSALAPRLSDGFE